MNMLEVAVEEQQAAVEDDRRRVGSSRWKKIEAFSAGFGWCSVLWVCKANIKRCAVGFNGSVGGRTTPECRGDRREDHNGGVGAGRPPVRRGTSIAGPEDNHRGDYEGDSREDSQDLRGDRRLKEVTGFVADFILAQVLMNRKVQHVRVTCSSSWRRDRSRWSGGEVQKTDEAPQVPLVGRIVDVYVVLTQVVGSEVWAWTVPTESLAKVWRPAV